MIIVVILFCAILTSAIIYLYLLTKSSSSSSSTVGKIAASGVITECIPTCRKKDGLCLYAVNVAIDSDADTTQKVPRTVTLGYNSDCTSSKGQRSCYYYKPGNPNDDPVGPGTYRKVYDATRCPL